LAKLQFDLANPSKALRLITVDYYTGSRAMRMNAGEKRGEAVMKVQSSISAATRTGGQTKSARGATDRMGVLIVNGHPITRMGLAQLINSQLDLVVCDEAGTAAKALDALNASKPNLVLSEIALHDKSGLELIKDIKAIRPGLPVLVISMQDEAFHAGRALRAGARGYITKHESAEELMNAIRHVLDGNIYVSKRISGHILETSLAGNPVRSSIEQLSDREFEVSELIGQGLSTHDIAKRLYLSVKTVQVHRLNVKRKLHLETSSKLISYAARWIEHRRSQAPARDL
jgi:DNA-binding NarL/FixJ family response regulator